MEAQAQLKTAILASTVRDFPKAYWEDARSSFRQGYRDVYHQIAADPNILPEQRIDALYQTRHFRMEYLLQKVSERHGISSSPTILVTNNRRYVFAAKGALAITQAYVPTIGAMPKPARYRERHAKMNEIAESPRLDFGDEPREVLLPKDFYALLAHNPVGARFDERDQSLGMLQLCVPVPDCSKWAAELTIEEILATYETAAPAPKPMREMPWKEIKKMEGDDT